LITSFDRIRRGRLPWGLLGAAVLVLLGESFLAVRDIAFTSPLLSSWSMGGESLRREAPRAEVLCLGDSLLKFGVAPRVLEERLGRRAYNGGVLANSPTMTYFLARRAIEAGARPRALVVEFNPMFLDGPPFGSRQWVEMIGPRECLDLAWTGRDAGFFARTMTGRLFRSVRRRFEVRENIMAALRGEVSSMPPIIHATWRNGNVNRGALLMPPYGPVGTVDPANLTAEFARPNWTCDPVQEHYLRRLLMLAEAHAVPVVWLVPPVSPAVQAVRDQVAMEEPHSQFLRSLQARFPGLVVVDGRRCGYDGPAFTDPLHLSARGASALSIDLAEALRPIVEGREAGPRWVNLPPYRERPVGVPLEDLNQSRTALNHRKTAIR